MEILTGLPEGIISNALYDVVKRILKKDPIRSSIDKAIDELIQEKPNDLFVLEEIDRNRKHIFNNINLTEEATFLKILTENEVLPETASRLYKKFSMKFKENIKEAALKEPEVFYPYAITEFEKINTDNKEIIKFLTGFALKNEVYLDRIIKHFKDLEKNPNISDIQSVLRKDETKEGEFFRTEPAWVDYEKGFIVERKEVDEIIKKLENDKIQLVLGSPASGKSIILKNVGFKLAKENKKVYVVELKKHPIDEIKIFFGNIPKIDTDIPIFIVDDAHLFLSYCERLAKDFKSKGKGNLIFGSRETREITEEHPKEGAEYELLSELSKTCIHVQAENVTERMVRTFLERQYHFDKDKIEIVSPNFDIYKKDLWLLSWALKAYNKDKESVNIEEINKKIAHSIEKIKVGKDKEPINAEDVFLPLSIFYRYEIPIERYFLEEKLGIDGKIINQLIGLQEISEIKEVGYRMLSMHHSSIAELYLGAYLIESDLGRRIKQNILNGENEKDLEFCLFYRYLMNICPRNSVNVFISLNRDFNIYFYYMDRRRLTKNLIEEEQIQKSIENGLDKEEDIGKIGQCILNIAWASKETALKLLESIDINILRSKIDKEDIRDVGLFVTQIALISTEAALNLVDRVSAKIDKEEDIDKIGECVANIAELSQEVVALKLVDSVSRKINKENDIDKIGWCVSDIAQKSKEVALNLLESIDINVLSSKINKEDDIENVGCCVKEINEASEEVALKLVESIDINVLSSKIDKEQDIAKVGSCLSDMAWTSKEVALKLVESIDINVLSSKIDKETDIAKVGLCMSGIADASKEVAMKFVESVNAKIDKEEDIGKVGLCVSGITRASKEVALKLMDSVKAKIDNELDMKKVKSCISGITRANKEVANEILNRLNPKLREELQKRMPEL